MESVFRGREKELEILDQKFQNEGFVMSVIYGRRRIGKTRLINKFIERHSCKSISFTAVERGETELLSLMSDAVLKALAPDMLGDIRFDSFEKLFEYVGKCAEKERIIFLSMNTHIWQNNAHIFSLLFKKKLILIGAMEICFL